MGEDTAQEESALAAIAQEVKALVDTAQEESALAAIAQEDTALEDTVQEDTALEGTALEDMALEAPTLAVSGDDSKPRPVQDSSNIEIVPDSSKVFLIHV